MIWFAKLALILWIPLTAFVASTRRPAIATAALVLGATLFLPERVAFNFPLIPPFGKSEIGQVSILAVLLITRPRIFKRELFGSGVGFAVIGILVFSMATAVTNTDALQYGPRALNAMTRHDGLSMAIRDALTWGAPFMLGRSVFRSSRDLEDLMKVIVVMALVYSLFILVELRLSPQFHYWVYGFQQHMFAQVVRSGGGYRPMVFMAHGLALALFVLAAGIAAAAVSTSRMKLWGLPTQFLPLVMFVILIMCKSLGAILLGLATFPVVLFMKPKTRVRIAVALGCVLIIYPIGRVLEAVPYLHLTDAAAKISIERAESLNFRFYNEEIFLEKARERIWFGWGEHRRSRIYNARSGKNEAIPDSFWVIWIGTRGVAGMACSLMFVVTPLFVTYRRFSRIRSRVDRQLVSGLALVLGVYCIDLTVNGLFTNLPIFFAGALLGVTKSLSAQQGLARRRRRQPRPAANHAPLPA